MTTNRDLYEERIHPMLAPGKQSPGEGAGGLAPSGEMQAGLQTYEEEIAAQGKAAQLRRHRAGMLATNLLQKRKER